MWSVGGVDRRVGLGRVGLRNFVFWVELGPVLGAGGSGLVSGLVVLVGSGQSTMDSGRVGSEDWWVWSGLVKELVDLRDQLSERGIFLWAVISESPTTEKTAQLLGLATRISKPRPEEGRKFAGANGILTAVICALDLSPTQLRIADEVSAALEPQTNPRPEIVRINKDGKLQAELWAPG